MDITTVGGNVGLKGQEGASKCEHECKTIKKSCIDLIDEDVDRDDVSALLWKGKLSNEEMIGKVCSKMSNRCPSKNTKASQAAAKERHDYPFIEISEKDLEMERLMAQMQASGMGGTCQILAFITLFSSTIIFYQSCSHRLGNSSLSSTRDEHVQ